jgi:hypothetical protein
VRLKKALIAALVALAAVIVVCGAAFTWLKFAPRRVPAGQRPLTTLSSASLASFRDTFNAGEGQIRVLALLSPT